MSEMKIKKFIGELDSLPIKKYKGKIGRDYLAVYGIWLLEKNGFEGLFDYIVAVLHKLFPEAGFSLTNFKDYPDSRTIHNTIWHLKDKKKKWVEGNTKSGYKLTKRGKIILEEVIKEIETGKSISEKKYSTDSPGKKVYWINEILKKSIAFRKFKENKNDDITNIDFILSLGATSNTSPQDIKIILEKFLEYSKDLKDKEATNYLKFVKKRFSDKNAD